MEKLRFEIMAKAKKDDEKSTWLYITSIQTIQGDTFEIPNDFQDHDLHTELTKTEEYKKAKNAIAHRHQKRNIWVLLNKELKNVYVDKSGNIQFKDCILEERLVSQTPSEGTINGISKEDLQEIISNIAKIKTDQQKNLHKLADKFILGKFNSKTNNVSQWIKTFESECERFDLENNQEKIEVLRLFLEGSCTDWYSSMLTKLTINSDWTNWKKNFCETYEDKGWFPTKYAIGFKYINGSLLDYALKKEKLLLEMEKSIDTKILINLIVAGLPDFITDRINKTKVTETKDMFNELRSLEHLTRKLKDNNITKTPNTPSKDMQKKIKTTCRICEGLGKKNRYHSEEMCWFNPKNKEENKIKLVNNNELEVELQNENQKN